MITTAGFLLINKPIGITSHDVIDILRHVTHVQKIGHAGTLDPFASGLLLVAIGKSATKQISRFVKLDKKYVALLRLGATSDTYDRTGVITSTIGHQDSKVSQERIQENLRPFIGNIQQTPPMYSAKKIHGKKLYEWARQGIEIERQPTTITIHSIELLRYEFPILELNIHCSSGTYIRSLAHDVGQNLGVGAYLESLTRTHIGSFQLQYATEIQSLQEEQHWEKFLFDQTTLL